MLNHRDCYEAETRDASFKHVPIVQKPISSVLEKIRLRNLEVLKKSGISDGSDCLVDTHTSLRDLNENFEPHVDSDSREDSETAEKDGGMHVMSTEGCDCDAKSADVEGLGFPDSLLSPNESTPFDTVCPSLLEYLDAVHLQLAVQIWFLCE